MITDSRVPAGLGAILLALLVAGCREAVIPPSAAVRATMPWSETVAQARGSTVVWRMWRGDPSINAYVDDWVAPRVKARFGITLHTIEGQGAEIVNQLVVEREAGAAASADLVWINGETFGQLRAEGLLDGPWAHALPNARYVDSTSGIIMRDFEQALDGFESPWGTVQFAMIYDTVRTPHPPTSMAELGRWILAHPGRFTHDQQFTGMTFLKGAMYALAGGVGRFQHGGDSLGYPVGRQRLFAWIADHKAAFWRGGTTYPLGVADLYRLFANGEVDFAMSANQNDVVTKVRQGILPPTSRALLLTDGTIANAHYLGIPRAARQTAGAMVVADFLLSPEAQLEKLRPAVWADGTVLAIDRLPPPWADRFARLEADPRALPADSLRKYARPEVSARFHARLQADWRAMVRSARP